MAVPDILIGSKLDAKGFKAAETQLSKLSRSVTKVAGAFGLAFGTRAMTRYSKNAIKAFAEDEKAARSLAIQLKNTGNAFAQPGIESFIANLERSTGILDEVLRPSFQTLLTSLDDVALAQKTLSLALDVSAGTGKDLQAVSLGLAKGYLGNTTSLTRLGAGLTKNILATGDMVKITDVLTKKFAGQAKSAVQGYSGQMALLTVASENSQEIIGKGLLDALNNLGGNTGIESTTRQMEALAQFTSDFVVGLSLIGKTKGSKTGILGMIAGTLGDVVKYGPLGKVASIGAASQKKPGYGSSNTVDQFIQAGGVIKKHIRVVKDDTAAIKAKTELDKLAAKFDLERINLYAALANATSEEEKARIRAKIAIVEQNETGAKAMNKLNDSVYLAASELYNFAYGTQALLKGYTFAPTGFDPNKPGFIGPTLNNIPNSIPTNIPAGMSGGSAEVFNSTSGTYMPQGMAQQFVTNLTVTAGTITDKEGVYEVVQQAIQEINTRGWSQFRTGALQVL